MDPLLPVIHWDSVPRHRTTCVTFGVSRAAGGYAVTGGRDGAVVLWRARRRLLKAADADADASSQAAGTLVSASALASSLASGARGSVVELASSAAAKRASEIAAGVSATGTATATAAATSTAADAALAGPPPTDPFAVFHDARSCLVPAALLVRPRSAAAVTAFARGTIDGAEAIIAGAFRCSVPIRPLAPPTNPRCCFFGAFSEGGIFIFLLDGVCCVLGRCWLVCASRRIACLQVNRDDKSYISFL
jgi:hypothetical protein